MIWYDIICRKSYHTKQGNRNHTWWLWYQEFPDQSNNSTCSAHRNASHTCRVMCPLQLEEEYGAAVALAFLVPAWDPWKTDCHNWCQIISKYINILGCLHVFTKCAVNTAVVFGKLQCVDLVNWYTVFDLQTCAGFFGICQKVARYIPKFHNYCHYSWKQDRQI